MSQEYRQEQLREKTHELLHGALKHVRAAALAAALVPLGAVAPSPAVAQDCGSGGCIPSETPTVTVTETPTDTPTHTPTNTVIFTWTPADTPTGTPPHTETPTVGASDTPADTPTHTPTPTPSPTLTGTPCPAISIRSNFNRAAIAGGNCIWFSSVFNPSRLGAGPTTIVVQNQTVRFRANGQPFAVSVPRAVITFDANAINATTTFDTVGNQWVTQVPLRFNRDVFLAGVMFPVAGDLPGGINPVTWSGSFSSDADRVRLHWKWAAAVYTKCDTGLDALGVKPVDGRARNPYPNSDHAGTPETVKSFVIGGARGGGGSNYTGFYGDTKSVTPCD